MPASGERPARPSALSWPLLILAAWIFGCGISAYRGFGRWRSVRHVVERSFAAPQYVLEMAATLAADLRLRHVPEVRMSHEVVTPLVTGLRQPLILLPFDRFKRLSAARQRMRVCHELVHLKRSDLWLGCIPAIAERLFFFHPLALVAVREYVFWREAACDAAVLETLQVAPREYGGLLLDLGVVRSRTRLAAAGAPWSFRILKRRIVMLRDPSVPSIPARILAPVVIGLGLTAIVPLQLSARPAAYPLTIDANAAPAPRVVDELH